MEGKDKMSDKSSKYLKSFFPETSTNFNVTDKNKSDTSQSITNLPDKRKTSNPNEPKTHTNQPKPVAGPSKIQSSSIISSSDDDVWGNDFPEDFSEDVIVDVLSQVICL